MVGCATIISLSHPQMKCAGKDAKGRTTGIFCGHGSKRITLGATNQNGSTGGISSLPFFCFCSRVNMDSDITRAYKKSAEALPSILTLSTC